MKTFLAILGVLSGVLSILRLRMDPENIRLKTILEIEKETEKLRKRRDEIISLLLEEESDALSAELGDVTLRIVFLRKKKGRLG